MSLFGGMPQDRKKDRVRKQTLKKGKRKHCGSLRTEAKRLRADCADDGKIAYESDFNTFIYLMLGVPHLVFSNPIKEYFKVKIFTMECNFGEQ